MEDKETERYFLGINKDVRLAYDAADKDRKQGYDPEDKVAIPLTKNLAERVVGLISVAVPQIMGKGIPSRITELEKKFGAQDWRVALTIAGEVADGKFCEFENRLLAMEAGMRVGFAYITMGTVASPLEGFVRFKVKKRKDGKDYLVVYYSGPIRSAGGTGASVSVLIADYLRKKMGFDAYDPREEEIKRMITEVHDYNDRVTNLQYMPSEEEIMFLVKNLPLQIDGDPSEELEVSNYKDLTRIETNRVRNGPCLVLCECLAQKAPKLWNQISQWGAEFDLEHWSFLQEFLGIQYRFKSMVTGEEKEGLSPVYTYIKDLVAGRPVLSHPMGVGGFRLRYGRSRISGFSAASIHPATSLILNSYIATGTQLKVERPGKAAAITFCDSIDGPIVKLNSGSLVKIGSVQEAKQVKDSIREVLFLGDILFNYGDFYNRAHILLPAGYCEELWIQELEREIVNLFGNIDLDKLSNLVDIEKETLERILDDPLGYKPKAEPALQLSRKINVPFHPSYSYYWKTISVDALLSLVDWLDKSKVVGESGSVDKIILPLEEKPKRILELLGVPHKVANNEFVIIEKDDAFAFAACFNIPSSDIGAIKKLISENKDKDTLTLVNILSGIKIKDKAGVFIGARMGRPEKAKMRKLTGSPHVLFPVGEEGGKLRSFQSALESGKITGEFAIYKCSSCNKTTVFGVCEECGRKTERAYYCDVCGPVGTGVCPKHGEAKSFAKKEIEIKTYFGLFLKKLGLNSYPDLIKGVRGTSNKDHIPEHLIKGILRSKHNVNVNKDGTIRYDMTQLPLTHFKPAEIGTSVEKLKELGYTKDISGAELTDEEQLLELKAQDVILPACDESPEEGADKILFRSALFIDELLTKLYGLKPFYSLKSEKGLAGQLVLVLAPHTSAGIVARIIGFSKTQGFFAHPMLHAATRRDCFSYDTYMPFFINKKWQIKKIGQVVEELNPERMVDNYGTKEAEAQNIKTIGSVQGFVPVKVNNFTKHAPIPMVKIKTNLGRTLKITCNHKQITFSGGKEKLVLAKDIKVGDCLGIPCQIDLVKNDVKKLNLLNLLAEEEWVMVRGLNDVCDIKSHAKKHFNKRDYDNYTGRDSYPLKFVNKLIKNGIVKDIDRLFVAAKQDTIKVPAIIDLTDELLKIIGLYVAEGYSRMVGGKKGLHQVYIASSDLEIREFIKKTMNNSFGLKKSENKQDRITYSSRILYHLFVNTLQCGSSAYEKRMPFLNLPSSRAGCLLSGYFEGDGSVSKTDLRITFDTVSKGLLKDIDFIFGQMGIFIKNYTYTKKPGEKLKQFYEKKGRDMPIFTITKGIIQSIFVEKFAKNVNFLSKRKKDVLSWLLKNRKPKKINQNFKDGIMFDTVKSVEFLDEEETYCLNVKNHKVIANSLLSKQCDGDEASVMLLLDALVNFSRQFLPATRGATQDAPLVLTSKLIPAEVDDMVFDMDVVWRYPLEFYDSASSYKNPREVKVEQLSDRLNTEKQYRGFGFTHSTTSINDGVRCSAYKILPSMQEKLLGQMDLAEKIRAVDEIDVARLVIEKHFLPDIKGNLRKFSIQQFRCVNCNEKYRRPPLVGKCTKCGGRIIFTISEGSIIKYLEPAISIAKKYNLPSYLRQTLELTKRNVESVFGKEKEKQVGLAGWV